MGLKISEYASNRFDLEILKFDINQIILIEDIDKKYKGAIIN